MSYKKIITLKDRTNKVAERVAKELHGKNRVIDEINSEIYAITDAYSFMLFDLLLNEFKTNEQNKK